MKRAIAVLALLILAAPAPAQDEARLRELLQRLEDDRIGVRAASAEELAKLGREWLPLLRRAAADGGIEKCDRLKEIIRKIEDRERVAALLPPASLITLNEKNQPLREVLLKIAQQSRTIFDVNEVPEDATVTVAMSRVPFWRAIEDVCKASGRIMPVPEGDHIGFTAEPYVALPGLMTKHFRVTLERIELSSNGTFGQPDHFERFNSVFNVCWEKGARPWRLTARLHEIVDEAGVETGVTEFDPEAVTPPLTADSIGVEVPLGCQRGPGPQAMKLNRLKVGIELEFPLRYAELRLDVTEGRLPPVADGREFSAKLSKLDRQEGALTAVFSVGLGRVPLEGEITSESFILRDRKDKEYHGIVIDSPPTPDNEPLYQVTFPDAPDTALLKEIVIRIPAEVHRERLDIDLKDLPLK